MGRVDVVILGIDPGTANTGYGVVARRGGRLVALDGGVVETSPRSEMPARLAVIHARVAELIAESDECAVSGALFDAGRQLSALISRPTTSMPASVEQALSSR